MVDKCLSQLWYTWYLCRELSKQLRQAGGVLTFYGPKHERWCTRPGYTNLKPTWSSWFFPFEIFKEATRDGVNIVHLQFEYNTFGPLSTSLLFPLLLLLLSLLRLRGTKTVVTIHSSAPRRFLGTNIMKNIFPSGIRIPVPAFWRIFPIFIQALYRLVGIFPHAIIVHNRVIRNWLIKDYGIDSNKIHVVLHGVDDAKPDIKRSTIRFWQRKLAGKRAILFFGTMSPRKGLEHLLQIFLEVLKTVPNSMLVLAGLESPQYRGYVKRLESLAEELGLGDHVLFTGPLPSDDVHALFSIAPLVVLPYLCSVASSGPLSFAIQHHKPIVASRTEILSEELLDGETAVLVSIRDHRGTAKVLETLIKKDVLRSRLSKNIGIVAKERSWAQVARKTIDLYGRI